MPKHDSQKPPGDKGKQAKKNRWKFFRRLKFPSKGKPPSTKEDNDAPVIVLPPNTGTPRKPRPAAPPKGSADEGMGTHREKNPEEGDSQIEDGGMTAY
ncbi:MAG: hypothetical protein ABFS03_01105 [Chloroflexota bacterium]